jgi:hypothetical protein
VFPVRYELDFYIPEDGVLQDCTTSVFLKMKRTDRCGLDIMHSFLAIMLICLDKTKTNNVRLKVFTAVTMKNVIFWDVTSCGSCANRRFGGT